MFLTTCPFLGNRICSSFTRLVPGSGEPTLKWSNPGRMGCHVPATTGAHPYGALAGPTGSACPNGLRDMLARPRQRRFRANQPISPCKIPTGRASGTMHRAYPCRLTPAGQHNPLLRRTTTGGYNRAKHRVNVLMRLPFPFNTNNHC